MSTLLRWNPVQEMLQIQNEFDRLFEDSFGRPRLSRVEATNWGLALDVVENEEAFLVKASIPGVNPDDLDITITDNVLTITGELKEDSLNEGDQYQLRERRFGHFSRSLNLPLPVKNEEIDAVYENGILTLHIPKMEEVKPKRIAIKTQLGGQKVIEG